MFRLPPDFRVQARHIFSEGILKNPGLHSDVITRSPVSRDDEVISNRKIGIISTNSHDGRIFSHEMKKVLADNASAALFHLEIPEKSRINEIITRIKTFNPDGIVLYLSTDDFSGFLAKLDEINDPLSIYIPWIPGISLNYSGLTDNVTIYQLMPFSVRNNKKYASFLDRFSNAYGAAPNVGSAYAYDALCLVMDAIKKSGLNRAKIRASIAANSPISGVTGKITWDNGGGNKTQPVLQILDIRQKTGENLPDAK